MEFKLFKPMNLAPQGFTSVNLIEKMKEFITNFISSAEVIKEVSSTDNMAKWLKTFKLESMPREAIDELIQLIEVAEDKNKIALIDLVRLVLMSEHSAAHILNKHWSAIELNVFGYLQCMDLKDADNKVI
jgi:replicative DNA helicase